MESYVIFCDDVRQETGNKLSLMGIFDNTYLQFAQDVGSQATAPRMSIYISFKLRRADMPKTAKLKITNPDGSIGAELDVVLSAASPEGDPEEELHNRIWQQASNLSFRSGDAIKVVLVEPDGREKEIGRLNLQLTNNTATMETGRIHN